MQSNCLQFWRDSASNWWRVSSGPDVGNAFLYCSDMWHPTFRNTHSLSYGLSFKESHTNKLLMWKVQWTNELFQLNQCTMKRISCPHLSVRLVWCLLTVPSSCSSPWNLRPPPFTAESSASTRWWIWACNRSPMAWMWRGLAPSTPASDKVAGGGGRESGFSSLCLWVSCFLLYH